MDIGKEKKEIILEPVESPVVPATPDPVPVAPLHEEPATEPVREPAHAV